MGESPASTLIFYVNGHKVEDASVDPETTLIQYLRNKLRLCGTKLGCSEGGCGACTVMVSGYDKDTKKTYHLAVNACLTPVCAMHGLAVTTVEGIGSIKTGLHAVQDRMAKFHGSQCGFCTPGFVMSMYALLRNNNEPSIEDIETCLQGNLCRCTGYRPILDAFKTFASNGCCGGRQPGTACCRLTNSHNEPLINGTIESEDSSLSTYMPYDPTQEVVFPPELMIKHIYDQQALHFENKRMKWIRPNNLQDLIILKHNYPKAPLVVGNSEIGIDTKFRNMHFPVVLVPTIIPELRRIEVTEDGVVVGAANTLTSLEKVLTEIIAKRPPHQTRTYVTIIKMLKLFAGKQIRNVAAVVGNIMTASPISDLNPIFVAAKVTLGVTSIRGKRTVMMDENFFTRYRKTVVKDDEVVESITIPFTQKDEYIDAYKQSRRRDDDIAIVTSSMRVLFHSNSDVVREISLVYGGLAPTTVLAKKAMESLRERAWNESILPETYSLLAEDLPLDPSAPGGMTEFRRTLSTSFFFKFFLTVKQQLHADGTIEAHNIPNNVQSAIDDDYQENGSRGGVTDSTTTSVVFPSTMPHLPSIVSEQQSVNDPIGRPLIHASALKQTTGEAIYCSDMPKLENELSLALVMSSKAHARIVKLDATDALNLEGVIAFFCHRDIKASCNKFGVVHKDEEVFASSVVTCHSQTIGAIAAVDQITAQRAARLVRVEYEDLEPVILTMEDAIAQDAVLAKHDQSLSRGDIEAGVQSADYLLEGTMQTGGQEHFYLEPQCAIAIPHEDDEMEIICSTQSASFTQHEVASVLEVPANKIVCRVKRMGGGFGGKESRGVLVAIPCAFAAHRLQRPVRCVLDRDEDMAITGTRHPFLGKYKVGFKQDGKITAVDTRLYANIGNSMDLSHAVMARAIYSLDNCYNIPNFHCHGSLCRTNLPSNTAFRGFGGPQGMLITESMMHDVATFLKVDPAKVRELNLYAEGDTTPFNQQLVNCTIRRCWEECLRMSDYWNRRQHAIEFNGKNRWRKRGLAIIPTKFAISFTEKFLNQSGALVHIYLDGSVLVTHGGAEMGQGLHTKMIQVTSRALGIPASMIHISEMSTDKVPNASSTAASCSSDLNGMAILNACKVLNERLDPFIKANPKGQWQDWVTTAYRERVSLSATGFYRTPNLGHDPATGFTNLFNYFCYGVGCSEVEIDCLTGDHQVRRTDIIMDVGESLNPAIDIGQIEGAFVQGYGLFTLEEVYRSPNGFLFSRGPGTYKLPSLGDIPKEFNVALLRGAPNPRAVYSSKAVGEPPLFLAASVFFAIKDAVEQARKEEGIEGVFQLNSPATADKIRMACVDKFTEQFVSKEATTFTPWCVSC